MPPKTPLPNLSSQQLLAPCPCGNQSQGKAKPLANCCMDFILEKTPALTAEALMRSRYTAHSLLAIDYLWNTWSAEQRLRSNKHDIESWASSCDWLQLQIISTSKGQPDDNDGTVEFVALYRQNGNLHQHHEISVFKKTLGKWLYIDHQNS